MFSNQVVVRPDEIAYTFNASADAPFSRLVLNEAIAAAAGAWDPANRDGGHECDAGAVQGEVPRLLLVRGAVPYATADIRGGGSDCVVIWTNYIVDVRYIHKGQDLYMRLAKSELGRHKLQLPKSILQRDHQFHHLVTSLFVTYFLQLNRRDGVWKIPVTAAGMATSKQWYSGSHSQKKVMLGSLSTSNELGDEDPELPFVSSRDIISATNNFSEDNMLGRGGFGKVYKGVLVNEKEVAIKRLGKGSRQGVEEFRNEVVQHRNLVRLLGCCIHGDEKLLEWRCAAAGVTVRWRRLGCVAQAAVGLGRCWRGDDASFQLG
ncbi:Receptor-like serine/threonine-protein kinase SD1-6 [Dichanthelium oligosanthes]|uniref:Receptor-like serine/threonine-protein kinase SD1-6 n=1 Tax=Dichanthelium oligosanthes TaxID=888268 RepID=A0A1E5W8R8_9POAL|nr:Receptor-like serine/threonine-protein kinase SD1-6 [Dichanthelium oligosanthes]